MRATPLNKMKAAAMLAAAVIVEVVEEQEVAVEKLREKVIDCVSLATAKGSKITVFGNE
ncbi:MAG: hypothetical protein NY202_04305 [Mollicutes bacterium UO1]